MIDLHIHTKHSDGNHIVQEVLIMAEELRNSAGLQVISITDHDDVVAYQELKDNEIRQIYKGEIISGIELSFNLDNRLYDLLGYDIDANKMLELLDARANVDKKLERENKVLTEFINICHSKGIEHRKDLKVEVGNVHEAFNVVWNDISNFDEHPKNKSFKEYINKDNINVFHKKHFLNPDSEFFVNLAQYSPTLKEAVDMIHKCGGKAFLAHSFVYGLDDVGEFIEYAVSCGIDGIEKYYSAHTEEQEKFIQEYADRYNLYISGGTDFHGEITKPGVKIGVGKGNMNIPINVIEGWIKSE